MNEGEALNRGSAKREIGPLYPARVGRFSNDLFLRYVLGHRDADTSLAELLA
jgi:hypothetical protein